MAITQKEKDELFDEFVEKLSGEKISTPRTSSEDIFSPKAQKEFTDYAGTREQFEREKMLRQIASGKKDTAESKFFGYLTAIVFRDRDIAKEVESRYQQRYSTQEIEEAKKTLEKEFGVKKKRSEDALLVKKFRKTVKDEVSSINQSIMGITIGLNSLAKDISRANGSLKSISDNLIGTINKSLTVLAGGKGDLDRTPDKMKPVTIADEEGKEYLYYPDAPPGRQLYEKSKTGTAGKIASKKIQRKLQNELKRSTEESRLQPIRAGTGDSDVDSIVDRIQVLLEEESMFRKKDMEKLFDDLVKAIEEKQAAKLNKEIEEKDVRAAKLAESSVFNLEADEQQSMLINSLEKALQRVIQRNPDLFNQNMSGSSELADTAVDVGIGAWLAKKFGTRGAAAVAAEAAAAGAATGAATTAATGAATGAASGGILSALSGFVAPLIGAAGATFATFGAIDYGMKSSADKNIRKIIESGSVSDIATALQAGSPQQRAYKLQEFRKIASENPELQKKLVEAESIAGYTGLKPQDVLENKTIPKQKEVKNDLSISPARDIGGQQIIDQNQKRIDIQSAEKVEIPAQTVNNINSTQVIPVPSNKKTIEIHNSENTFNRLLAQDFDHPATYSTMNMG